MIAKSFSSTLATATDQEIIVYSARHIKKIDNISSLNPSVLNLVEAQKITEVICNGSTTLSDIRLSSNNKFLRTLSLNNCTKLGTSSGGGNQLDLSALHNLVELDIGSTSLESLVLPSDGCNLQILRLPTKTMKKIELQNMPVLDSVGYYDANKRFKSGLPSEVLYNSIKIVNCPKLSVTILSNSTYPLTMSELWLENSFFDQATNIKINFNSNSSLRYKNRNLDTLVLKNLECFKKGLLAIVVGGVDVAIPKTRKIEIQDVEIQELKLVKVGYETQQELDLSNSKIGAVNICGYGNLSDIILPDSIKGIAVTKTEEYADVGVGNNLVPFPEEYKTLNSIYIKGHKKENQLDFSSCEITEYLKLELIVNVIKLNCDFTKGTGLSFRGAADRFSLNVTSLTDVSGYVKCANGCITYAKDIRKFSENLILDTSEVTIFREVFKDCVSLIGIPQLDTSKATNFNGMFSGCRNLKNIPMLNTSQGVYFNDMFKGCSNLVEIPLLDTSKGTDFSNMFNGCNGLTNIPQLNTSQGMYFSNMFGECYGLTNIPMLNTSQGTNFYHMFSGCSGLTNIPQLNTSQGIDFRGMFSWCSGLTEIPQLDTQKGTRFGSMFDRCSGLTEIPQLNTSLGTEFYEMFRECTALTEVQELDTSSGESFWRMFENCKKLKIVHGIDLTQSTNATGMFNKCDVLESIKINGTIGRGAYIFAGGLMVIDNTTIESIIAALVDYTGEDSVAIHLSAGLINRMTDEQKAAISAKNWTIKVAQ